MPWAVHEGDVPQQSELSTAAHSIAGEGVRSGTATRPVAARSGTPLVVTMVHLWWTDGQWSGGTLK